MGNVSAGVYISDNDFNSVSVNIQTSQNINYEIWLLTEKDSLVGATCVTSGSLDAGEYYDKSVEYEENHVQICVRVVAESNSVDDTYTHDLEYTKPECSHNWEFDYKVEETCSTNGYYVYKCTKCGEEKTEPSSSAYGHKFGANGICEECGTTAFSYEVSPDYEITITGYEGDSSEIEIPDTIDGYQVVHLGSYAFEHLTNLTSITIPDSVTSIGNDAFCQCSNLTSITIPNSVTIIGDYAFDGCKNLTIYYEGSRIGWNNIKSNSTGDDFSIPSYVQVIFKYLGVKIKINGLMRNIIKGYVVKDGQLRTIMGRI